MTLEKHTEFEKLYRRIKACANLVHPWKGYIYRNASPKYSDKTMMISGRGSLKHGGRWNAPGTFPAIYGSLSSITAVEEALAQAHYYGLGEHTIFPRIFVAVHVSLNEVLNLTAGSVRKHLIVSRKRMVSTDWRKEQDKGREAVTQAIGSAAFEAGYEGLLVPSAATRNGANLVVFRENLGKNSTLRSIDPDEMP